jgi:hypothetical protein
MTLIYKNFQKIKNFFKKHKRKIPIFGIVIIAVSALVFFMISNESYVQMDSGILELISDMELTDAAKKVLRQVNPQLKDKKAFNGICGYDGDPRTYVAGCYYPTENSEHIDIYNSGADANSLEKSLYDYRSSKQVTLAHEMMHAVYEKRVSDADKTWINSELDEIYLKNSDIKEELSIYPEEERHSELYARTATEIKDVSDKLEKHFTNYFKDRMYIVNKYQTTKKQIIEMMKGADEILEQAEKQRQKALRAGTWYDRYLAVKEYNRLIELYNKQIEVYRATKDKMDSEK